MRVGLCSCFTLYVDPRKNPKYMWKCWPATPYWTPFSGLAGSSISWFCSSNIGLICFLLSLYLVLRLCGWLLILLGKHEPHLLKWLRFRGWSIPITCLWISSITSLPECANWLCHRLLIHASLSLLMVGFSANAGLYSWNYKPLRRVIGYVHVMDGISIKKCKCDGAVVSVILDSKSFILFTVMQYHCGRGNNSAFHFVRELDRYNSAYPFVWYPC